MTNDVIALLDKVQQMRQAQNAFFKFKGDPEQKKGILIRSKQLETEVDIETARLKDALVLNGLTTGRENLELTERARVIGGLILMAPRLNLVDRIFTDALIDYLKANRKDARV